MKKLLLLAAAATTLSFSTVASATVIVDSSSITKIDGPIDLDGTTTIGYTEAGLSTPTFSEFLTFTNDMAGEYFFSLSTSSPNIAFTSAVLTGAGSPYALDKITAKYFALDNLFLDPGQYTLTINGNNAGTGVLEGSITIAQAESAVPEPTTWAMMLVGFGAVGFGMRRRRKSNEKLRVRFAV